MDDRYYYRKNLITATVMLVFALAQMMIGIGTGYYWNGFQAQLSGIGDIQTMDAASNVWGDILAYILVFTPIATVAYLSSAAGKNSHLRFLLVIPMFVYFISAVLDLKKILPFDESFGNIYAVVDHIIYVPFIVCYLVLSVYYVLVIALPQLLGTRAVGVLAMIIAITFYLLDMLYVIYLHGMGLLNGSFGVSSFILYLVCFALDVATFFLMLSVLMSYCAMQRERLLDIKDEQRYAQKQTAKNDEERPDDRTEDEDTAT
jgi:hypothetical protein